MPDPLVTVTAYAAGDDARLAKGALDSAGIDSLVDEAIERRARVRVQNVDALRAGDVLNTSLPALSEIDEPDEEPAAAVCPACGSTEIGPSRRARSFMLIILMALALGAGTGFTDGAFVLVSLSAVVLLITGRQRCAACNETWD